MSDRICPKCQKVLRADDAFCSNCGTAVPKEPPKPVCHGCGKELAVGDKFCSSCGTAVSASQEPSAAVPAGESGGITDALASFLKKYPKKTITRAFGALGAAMIALIAVGLFLSGGDAKDSSQTSSAPERNDPPSVSDGAASDVTSEAPWRNNVLMENKLKLENGLAHTGKVFGTDLTREEIGFVVFLDSFEELERLAGASLDAAWDVSQAQDGSVRALARDNGDNYLLFIAGEGGVAAPEDCSFMFSHFVNAIEIDFQGAFHTENTKSMSGMFANDDSLHTLRAEFDTSQVTEMMGMFTDCERLSWIDTSGWDTGNVTDMSGMFYGSTAVKELDVKNWDTSNVTAMYDMFAYCSALETLDLSSWDISRVESMQRMFLNTSSLTNLNISGWDLSQVDTTDMFEGSIASASTGAAAPLRQFFR